MEYPFPKKSIPKSQPSMYGVEYTDQPLVFEHYKEPLMAISKENGYGYYGTLAMTQDGELMQCHICGNLFKNVGLHIRKHNVKVRDYKKKYQLSFKTPLISDKTREARQNSVFTQKRKGSGLPPWLKEYNRKVQSGEIKHSRPGKDMSLEERNKRGLCADQVLEKIKDAAEILGRVPSNEEFRELYKGKYYASICYFHGSWSEAVRRAGMFTREQLRRPDKQKLIQDLIDFHDLHDRIPMTSDFNGRHLRDKTVYIRQFGTLNNARIEAGMDAVVSMPFGQHKIIPAQEFLTNYKTTRQIRREKSAARGVDNGTGVVQLGYA